MHFWIFFFYKSFLFLWVSLEPIWFKLIFEFFVFSSRPSRHVKKSENFSGTYTNLHIKAFFLTENYSDFVHFLLSDIWQEFLIAGTIWQTKETEMRPEYIEIKLIRKQAGLSRATLEINFWLFLLYFSPLFLSLLSFLLSFWTYIST